MNSLPEYNKYEQFLIHDQLVRTGHLPLTFKHHLQRLVWWLKKKLYFF